jgi:hypothetical protein
MTRYGLVVLGLLLVLVGSAAAAPTGETDAGSEMGATGEETLAREETGVTLAYKWQPGQMLRYRVIGDGVMHMTMPGPTLPGMPASAGSIGAIPMEFEILMDLLQRVKKVHPDGSATLVQRVRAMMMTTRALGMEIRVKLDQGKVGALLNGQPAPMIEQRFGARGADLSKAVEVRLSPRGKILDVGGAAKAALERMFQSTNLGGLFGNGTIGAGLLTMPKGAVLMGQSWAERQSVRIPIEANRGSLSSVGRPQLLPIEYAVKHTCSEIAEDGRRVIIESVAEATLPRPKTIQQPDPRQPGQTRSIRIHSFRQQIGGRVHFDPTAGIVRNSDYTVDMGMTMEVPTPATQASGGPKAQVAVDATFKLKVLLMPEYPARRASSKP